MNERLTSTGLTDFLKDFEDKSFTEIFERGKEKDEIIKIAKAKMGIDLKNNTDLAGFKTIYTFANIANGNKARLPKHLILKALPTLIGKPVNVNHVRNYVVGYYIDYRYIESKDQVVAYGLFFKSNFGAEWTRAKELLKSNQLGTSHEVWSPKKSRRKLGDGTFEASAIEFAGGALIYRGEDDPLLPGRKMRTAYNGCDVLEMAMQHMDEKPKDMIFASLETPTKKQYKDEDLITASDAEEFAKRIESEIQEKVDTGFHKSHEQESDPNQIVENQEAPVVQIPKVICGHCKNEFETQEVGEIGCEECKSIVNRKGEVLYPPQIINFRFNDPDDGFANWRLIDNGEETAIVKNTESGKIYELKFKTADDNDHLMNKMNFIYIGSASCPQCGHAQSISTTSNVEKSDLECPRCELKFSKNIKKETMKKQISEYLDITEDFKNRMEKKEAKKQMADSVKELHVASLQENSNVELEIANLTDHEESICVLEIASLQETEASLELEIASQDSAEQVPSEDVLVLDTASLIIEPTSEKLDRLEKYKKFVKKAINKIHAMRKEVSLDTASLKSANELEIVKIQEDADIKIGFYKTNAVELIKRRNILGEFGDDLSDIKIMDDEVFALAKSEKDNALLKASLNSGNEVVGDKTSNRDNPELNRLHSEIDEKAFKTNS